MAYLKACSDSRCTGSHRSAPGIASIHGEKKKKKRGKKEQEGDATLRNQTLATAFLADRVLKLRSRAFDFAVRADSGSAKSN
eukprot:2859235-Rhodomonas_salina.2